MYLYVAMYFIITVVCSIMSLISLCFAYKNWADDYSHIVVSSYFSDSFKTS